jgi:hypothetical protein
MIIEATRKNVEWLIERLYEEKRRIMCNSDERPVFVLLTRTREERCQVEAIILSYFAKKYGDNVTHMTPYLDYQCDRSSRFSFPEIASTVLLMDI